MLPPRTGPAGPRGSRTRLDPSGYYALLGLEPGAPQASVVTAYRAKARVLHPDVPETGNAAAFVAVKQAYDVLSNPRRRQDYDRSAEDEPLRAADIHEAVIPRPATAWPAGNLMWPLSTLTITILAGLAAFLCLSVYEVATHLMAPAPVPSAKIRPNAATVEPLSASEHRAILYGPAPVQLAATSNFYVAPAGSPTVLWQIGQDRKTLVALAQLPPFSTVQGVRLLRQSGMVEVLLNGQGVGLISADHLAPGDARAAKSAYCSYNAGPMPSDGEVLEHRGSGGGTLALENRAVQPAVVKLRGQTGAAVLAVFLSPGGHVELDGLPEGVFRPEFAIGELWSRACGMFAAGMRAQRMEDEVRLPGASLIVVAPARGTPAAFDISDQAFQAD